MLFGKIQCSMLHKELARKMCIITKQGKYGALRLIALRVTHCRMRYYYYVLCYCVIIYLIYIIILYLFILCVVVLLRVVCLSLLCLAESVKLMLLCICCVACLLAGCCDESLAQQMPSLRNIPCTNTRGTISGKKFFEM